LRNRRHGERRAVEIGVLGRAPKVGDHFLAIVAASVKIRLEPQRIDFAHRLSSYPSRIRCQAATGSWSRGGALFPVGEERRRGIPLRCDETKQFHSGHNGADQAP
jgi:hypothetical protein